MADFALDGGYAVEEAGPSGTVATFINWAGAAVSLALIGGLAVWGWQLLQRDVSGVPVITALEGPMRIAPDNPGGIIAEHQGLAVNRIPAVGEAAPGADTVVLAPQTVDLTEEDAAMSALLPDTSETSTQAETADQPHHSPADLAVISALAGLEEELSNETGLESATEDTDGASAGAVTISPRPAPRPEITLSSGMAAVPVSTAALGTAIDPGTIAPGTRLVQLGAFGTLAEAEAEWTRIDIAFSDYMIGKRRVIQEAETAGTTFYRLRAAGFDDLSDARRFCAVLVSGDASCIPVVAR